MEREERELTESMMKRECSMLLNEIRRLNMSRKMQHKRLKNVMNLVSISKICSGKMDILMLIGVRVPRFSAASISWIVGGCRR
jgi:hypothetical protein